MGAPYVLILIMHVGPLGSGNSNSLTTAEFFSKANCEAAGKAAQAEVTATTKTIKFVCQQK